MYGVRSRIHISSSIFTHCGEGSNGDAGNVIIVADESTSNPQLHLLSSALRLEVHDSIFSYNNNTPSPFKYYCTNLASGLSIVLKQSNVLATLSGLHLGHNSGCHGGNLAILFENEQQFEVYH